MMKCSERERGLGLTFTFLNVRQTKSLKIV